MAKINNYTEFLNESAILSKPINWEGLEQALNDVDGDYIPANAREWAAFKEQYYKLDKMFKHVVIERKAPNMKSTIINQIAGGVFKKSVFEFERDAPESLFTTLKRNNFSLDHLKYMIKMLGQVREEFKDARGHKSDKHNEYAKSPEFKSFVKSIHKLDQLHDKLINGWDIEGAVLRNPTWWLETYINFNSDEPTGFFGSVVGANSITVLSKMLEDKYSKLSKDDQLFMASKNISYSTLQRIYTSTIELLKVASEQNRNTGIKKKYGGEYAIIRPTNDCIFSLADLNKAISKGETRVIIDVTNSFYKAKLKYIPKTIVNQLTEISVMKMTADGIVNCGFPMEILYQRTQSEALYINAEMIKCDASIIKMQGRFKVNENSFIMINSHSTGVDPIVEAINQKFENGKSIPLIMYLNPDNHRVQSVHTFNKKRNIGEDEFNIMNHLF